MAYTSTYSGKQVDSAVAQATTNKTNIATLDTKLTGALNSINDLSTAIRSINNSTVPQLTSLIGEKATVSYVDQNVATLNQSLADKQAQLDTVKGSIGQKSDTAYVDQEIDTLRSTRVDVNTSAISVLNEQVITAGLNIEELQGETNALSTNLQTQVNRIDSEMNSLREALELQSGTSGSVQTQLDALNTSKVNVDTFNSLENRVTVNEELTTTISQNYVTTADVTTTLSSYPTYDSLSTTLISYAKTEDLTQYATTNFVTESLKLYVKLEDYNTKIQALESKIQELEAKIQELESKHLDA